MIFLMIVLACRLPDRLAGGRLLNASAADNILKRACQLAPIVGKMELCRKRVLLASH